MNNKLYLEEMKEARKRWMSSNNLDCEKILNDENCDSPRIATALEILAEELINNSSVLEELKSIKIELSVIANGICRVTNQ